MTDKKVRKAVEFLIRYIGIKKRVGLFGAMFSDEMDATFEDISKDSSRNIEKPMIYAHRETKAKVNALYEHLGLEYVKEKEKTFVRKIKKTK